jgi:selenocysteine lyase/cysteine desulfurase
VPTVSFTHDKATTHKIAHALAAADIYVWSGHNYAYEVVRHLGIDEKEGVVRVGIAHYNSEAEVERCLTAIAASVT